MEIRVEQPCPQCGGPVDLSASDRLLSCPYCGVKNFLLSKGPFRYLLPHAGKAGTEEQILHAPYLRFRGNVFLVTETGISYRVVDTTQGGFPLPGLPPSLGLRPQAMKLVRISEKSPGRFLRPMIKAKVILDKAVRITGLPGRGGGRMFHRAFIGEEVSYIYLPLRRTDAMLMDAVLGTPLATSEQAAAFPMRGSPFNPRWQISFLATLCPRCGWSLDGEGDCLMLTCSNCDTAWQAGATGLERIGARIVAGGPDTALYLGFWKIAVHLPAVKIWSFADFIVRTNQPLAVRKGWRERVLSFWIPAFKVRPKIFLQAGRQTTMNQWRLDGDQELHVLPNLYPVTLPLSEARQAVKVMLAASAADRKMIFSSLPGLQAEHISSTLVYLPVVDRNHDWLQPQTGATVAKSVLRFGRRL